MRGPLCSECFDKTCAGYDFQLKPQAVCIICGRKCLGYISTDWKEIFILSEEP